MNEDKNHINYSAADIEKYHRGELSPAAMHAMERAALDDPFLADAMEGYMVASGKNSMTKDDIPELKQRLAERIAEKDRTPVIGFAWWKVAAVVFLLLGGAWFYIALNSKERTAGIAQTQQKNEKQPSSTGKADSQASLYHAADTIAVHEDELAVSKKHAVSDKTNSTHIGNKKSANDAVAAELSSSAGAKNNEANQTETKEAAETGRELAKAFSKKDSLDPAPVVARSEVNKNATTFGADKKQEARPERIIGAAPGIGIASNSFNGAVVDQFNKPVANATVQVPTLNKAFVTDNNGYFSFKAPDTALNVSIASIGFEQQNARLNNNVAFNQVTLKPANQNLNEVVVIGYGTQKGSAFRRKTKDFSVNVLDAEPSVDWNTYTGYLEKNKRVRDETKDIHGDVVVSFVINNKNELTNFKIEKSLQTQLDAEAIRLIKEGPSWKLLKGKKAKASVIVKF